jgi:hypothetical protein
MQIPFCPVSLCSRRRPRRRFLRFSSAGDGAGSLIDRTGLFYIQIPGMCAVRYLSAFAHGQRSRRAGGRDRRSPGESVRRVEELFCQNAVIVVRLDIVSSPSSHLFSFAFGKPDQL